jgi:NAD(P)-dependent dehydrogenase (short-subunit alcohol dehydrogenase family)
MKDMNIKKDIIVLTGAGQLGMAIVRRMGYGNKIFVADWKMENAQAIAKTLTEAGFDAVPIEVDISSKESVLKLVEAAGKEGDISMFINAAGVSPSQASIEQVLKVDLYGTALLLEEFGKVIKAGGTGVVISSQSGYRMPALTADEDRQLATTPVEELLQLEVLKPGNIKDTLHAYQMVKRANGKRVMAEAVKWAERGARVNTISPGIIITPLALDEINGPRGDFYKNMFAKSPAGRAGIADEVANVAELLLSKAGAFITGSDFLIDGGATASYFYGPLQPEKN